MNRNVSIVGDIIVLYRVLYLAAGVTDVSLGQSGLVAAATGSVMLSNGQAVANVSVDLFPSSFIEENDMMYAEVNDTELNGGNVTSQYTISILLVYY